MNRFLLTQVICLIGLVVSAQEQLLQQINIIEGEVFEVSGITALSTGEIFVIGDSGNAPTIYQIDANGKVIHQIYMDGAQNVDWEDLQLDMRDNLYIGDTGNNLGNREELVIYKIANFSRQMRLDTIHYTYEDQISFEPDNNTPFDCEAFVILEDKIHLFSKDRGIPGTTKRYLLNTTNPLQEAALIDATFTEVWITGADYKHSSDELFFCSDQRVLLFSDYSTSGLSNQICRAEINTSQIEAIHVNQFDEFFLVEDVESGTASILYRFITTCKTEAKVYISSNPSLSGFIVESSSIIYKIKVFTTNGKLVESYNINNGCVKCLINLEILKPEVYILKVHTDIGEKTLKLSKL